MHGRFCLALCIVVRILVPGFSASDIGEGQDLSQRTDRTNRADDKRALMGNSLLAPSRKLWGLHFLISGMELSLDMLSVEISPK